MVLGGPIIYIIGRDFEGWRLARVEETGIRADAAGQSPFTEWAACDQTQMRAVLSA
jgi:hypothetical protein